MLFQQIALLVTTKSRRSIGELVEKCNHSVRSRPPLVCNNRHFSASAANCFMISKLRYIVFLYNDEVYRLSSLNITRSFISYFACKAHDRSFSNILRSALLNMNNDKNSYLMTVLASPGKILCAPNSAIRTYWIQIYYNHKEGEPVQMRNVDI